MNEKSLGETWTILIVAVIIYLIYLFGFGPLGVWLILNPLGVTVNYMGRVSISVGFSLLSSVFSSSSSSK